LGIKFFSLFIVAMTASVSASPAQDRGTRNAIDNTVSLVMANKYCTDYFVDLDRGSALLDKLGIQLAIEPNKSYFDTRISYTRSRIGELGIKGFCDAAYKDFHPRGPLSGLMMRK
jgi:hypothetical protein